MANYNWRAVSLGAMIWSVPGIIIIQMFIWLSGMSQSEVNEISFDQAITVDLSGVNEHEFSGARSGGITHVPRIDDSVWVLQVGAFVNESLAEALKKKLQSEGYSVFQIIKKRSDKKLILLRIGPFSSHNQISSIQAEIQQNLQISGIVYRVKYQEVN